MISRFVIYSRIAKLFPTAAIQVVLVVDRRRLREQWYNLWLN